MKQTGTVIEINGKLAKVECDRRSACDMCENAASCAEKCKKVYATAVNSVNASVGDYVEIETDTGMVLMNAFIVFLFPIFTAIAAYFLSESFFGEGVSAVVTLVVLAVSLAAVSFLMNKAAKKKTVSRIVKIF